MDRIILHCDLNCFYASVELLSHPDLRDVPMAVCGDPQSRHGIILAKNEPAKKFGVQTAETIWQAKKKCPDLVLLPPHHDLYREYSRKVNAIYDEYTDLVEPFGIDESWLDVTHTLHLFGGDARALADALRERMKRQLGLTLSWCLLFFGFQAFGLAFLWLLLLWSDLLGMIFSFHGADRAAALLQIPCFLWVTFAGYLNLMTWVLNW